MSSTKLITFKLAVHPEPIIDFLMQYLINNPKITNQNTDLNTAFLAAFPDEDLESELNHLYTLGLANRFAIEQFYISDETLESINTTHRTNRVPEWC